jgi:hypothetical protein
MMESKFNAKTMLPNTNAVPSARRKFPPVSVIKALTPHNRGQEVQRLDELFRCLG